MSRFSGTRLFFLSLGGEKPDPSHPHGAILTCKPDGSDLQTIVSKLGTHPDGLQYDSASHQIYYTNMGVRPDRPDGFISRVNADGSDLVNVVPPESSIFTPKQCTLESGSRTLYWCDREGMRIWRASLQEQLSQELQPELLYQSAAGDDARKDQTNHCVGITVDPKAGRIYWTQKGPSKGGVGRLFAASIDIPEGETPEARTDIVCLMDHLPEPIDLELDHEAGILYKTDRGAEPRGNTVSKVDLTSLGAGAGITSTVRAASAEGKVTEQILVDHLHEAIGLALDKKTGRMYFTDIGGSVYSANMDGSDKREILRDVGDLTGICVVHFDQ